MTTMTIGMMTTLMAALARPMVSVVLLESANLKAVEKFQRVFVYRVNELVGMGSLALSL